MVPRSGRTIAQPLAVLAAVLFTLTSQSARGDSTALEAALTAARAQRLAETLEWRRLVHYRPGFWGGPVSELDGRRFFISSKGKEDPEAELEATLAAFFAPVRAGHEDEHALCRFPARRRWLGERLGLEGAMTSPRCPALSRYRAAMDATSVSLVYASNYLGNPGSALGHTFLRIARRRAPGQTASSERLDYGIEYTVNPDTKNPLLYAYKGLTGGFAGRIEFRTFDYKARQYGTENDRDLWEYRLALTPREIELVVLHLWELTTTHVQYFYMTENCAYHVLAILEAAAPRIDLLSHANALIIPTDTVKAVASIPGLVAEVEYRPSLQTARQKSREPVRREQAPDRSHGSLRATVGAGATTQYGAAFGALGFRIAIHDLADPPDGGPELLQLQFLDGLMRARLDDGTVTLERLTIAELVALNPLSSTEKHLSWRVRGYGMRLHDEGCLDCFAHGPNVSVGLTFATSDEQAALFVMADAFALFPGDFDDIGGTFARAGLGPYGGLRLRLPGPAVAVVTGTLSWLPAQTPTATYDVRGLLRAQLGQDVAVGLEGAVQPSSMEVALASYLYF